MRSQRSARRANVVTLFESSAPSMTSASTKTATTSHAAAMPSRVPARANRLASPRTAGEKRRKACRAFIGRPSVSVGMRTGADSGVDGAGGGVGRPCRLPWAGRSVDPAPVPAVRTCIPEALAATATRRLRGRGLARAVVVLLRRGVDRHGFSFVTSCRRRCRRGEHYGASLTAPCGDAGRRLSTQKCCPTVVYRSARFPARCACESRYAGKPGVALCDRAD